jgi:hypothetical protein
MVAVALTSRGDPKVKLEYAFELYDAGKIFLHYFNIYLVFSSLRTEKLEEIYFFVLKL